MNRITIRGALARAVLVALVPGMATAGPLAAFAEDLDGDDVPEAFQLGSDGVLRIAGKLPGEIKLAAALVRGQLAVSRYRGRPYVVARIAAQAAASEEAVILGRDGGRWHELARIALGGVGLDHDYAIDVDATPDAIYRFQTRGDIRRCDGMPGYLFAEKFDGTRFRRVSALPTNVPEGAPVLAARLDSGPATLPVLYQARAASLQVGVADAGGLAIPRELDDGRLDTVWREELAASAGEGQFFTFAPRVPGASARQLRIVPGNPGSSVTMRSFNRPRGIAVVTAHGAWRVELPDAAKDPLGSAYVVDLPAAVEGCVTVVLESTWGPARGATAIAELEVFADGERGGGGGGGGGGGDALLAHLVAEGGAGATSAAATLARRGAPGAAAIDGELATTREAGARRRLIGALVGIADLAAAPALARAASGGWVHDRDLIDVIGALGALGQVETLRELAANPTLSEAARGAAIARLPVAGAGLALLLDVAAAVAGGPSRELRRAAIDRLSAAPAPALVAAAAAQSHPAAVGDLWRAATRSARAAQAGRAEVLAAMLAALPAATDYERRYRLVDGIATLGDAAALRALDAALRALPAGHASAALTQVAVRAIAGAPRPEALALVLAAARDRDPGVRLAAVAALSGGDAEASAWNRAPDAIDRAPDAIDRAIDDIIASDPWPEVRRRAATALGGRCHRPAPAHALTGAVDRDRELGVRGAALSALVQCHATGVGALLSRLWDDGDAPLELRSRAVLETAALGDPALAAALVGKFTRWRGEAIASADALALAQSAAAAIGRLDPPGAARALTEALDDTAFPEIVQAAAFGLGALGRACPPDAKVRLAAIAREGDQAAIAARHAAAQCGK